MLLDFLNFNKSKKGVCSAPFSQVCIDPDGNVLFCPDCYMLKTATIGNLNNNSFKEIWNSKKAVNIRKQILKKLYCYCSYEYCQQKSSYHSFIVPCKNIDFNLNQKKYPKMVSFGIDYDCNVNCIMCRKDVWHCSNDEYEKIKEKIDTVYLPILKDAEYLTVSTTSDPFASRASRLLIKKSAQMYPNLKFHILTNGILCDEFNCQELEIIDRLGSVMFSVHACTKQTYDSIVKNGNFERVCKNIELMSYMKSQGKLENFFLSFVVSSRNYFEIPAFIEFAKQHNALALFWGCSDWGNNLTHIGEDIQVCKLNHPKYQDLKRVLKSIELDSEHSHFALSLHHIRNN